MKTPLLRSSRLRGLALALPLLSILGVFTPGYAQSPVTEVIERASPTLATVWVLFARGETTKDPTPFDDDFVRIQRPGTGVVVSPDGLVLTNDHLIAETVAEDGSESDEFFLTVLLGMRSMTAKVVARDQRLDLALLQLELFGGEVLPYIPITRLEGKRIGERVVAMSRPAPASHYAFAGTLAFSGGPVLLREATLEASEHVLSDTRFHDNLDGGPLLDAAGRMLGLHNSSHIEALPENFEEEKEGEEKKVNEDYAVIVCSDAILEAFGEWLSEGTAPPVAPEQAAAEPAPAAIETVAGSVVGVWAGGEDYPPERAPRDPHALRISERLGSGVIVDAKGLILTTSTLFEGENETAVIRLADGTEYPAKLLEISHLEQIALLLAELPEGVALPAAELSNPAQSMPGELVAVVGRPFGGTPVTTVGVLSVAERKISSPWASMLAAMGKEVPAESGHFVQVASWIHSGVWGGALVDRDGKLLGVAVKQPEATKGPFGESYLGFAASIARARSTFAEAWAAYAPESAGEIPACSEEQLAARRTGAVGVVEATMGSLINIHVQKAVKKESKGFDPFGGGSEETGWQLQSMGSGVVIDETGLAISNWHVVDGAMFREGRGQNPDYRIEVSLPDGRSFIADVLSTSRDDDLSLLQLKLEPGEKLVPVPMADSNDLEYGQPVVAIGNPHGLADTVSAGIISGLDENVMIRGRLRKYYGMVMTDAAINPGNSGGALLDLNGHLIGINSAGSTGRGLAIPVNRARDVFSDKLLSAEKMRSVYLGLRVEEKRGKLVVEEVESPSPARDAGIEEDDILLKVGGEALAKGLSLAQARLKMTAGVPVPFVLERDGEELTLEVTPLSFEAWTIFRQCGIEVVEVDYAVETALVRDASVALYQAYTGNTSGIPKQLMNGALRVVRAYSIDDDHDLEVLPDDLVLGMNVVTRTITGEQNELVRFENITQLHDALAPRATKEGEWCECWLLRDGVVITTKVFAKRALRSY